MNKEIRYRELLCEAEQLIDRLLSCFQHLCSEDMLHDIESWKEAKDNM